MDPAGSIEKHYRIVGAPMGGTSTIGAEQQSWDPVWGAHRMVSDVGSVGDQLGSAWRAWDPLHFPMDPAVLLGAHRMGSCVGSAGIRRGSIGIRIEDIGSITFSNGSGRPDGAAEYGIRWDQ
jgi:hypothetical protein